MTYEEAEKIIANHECSRYSGLSNAKDHLLTLALCGDVDKFSLLDKAINIYEQPQRLYNEELK